MCLLARYTQESTSRLANRLQPLPEVVAVLLQACTDSASYILRMLSRLKDEALLGKYPHRVAAVIRNVLT